MAKSIDDLSKEVQKLTKDVATIQGQTKDIQKISKDISSVQNQTKELSEIKRVLKSLDMKLQAVMNKIQEFEVIMDAAELIEDHMNDHDDEDNEDWNPYGEDYEPEDYENYGYEDEEDN